MFGILIVYIFFTNCDLSKKNKISTDFQIQTIGKVCFNKQIDSFLTDFFNEIKEDSCIYELYIDKKDREEYQLSLLCKHANNQYFQEHYPINYTIIKGKTIFIYSGIEDFVNKDTYSSNFKSVNHGSPEYVHAWYKIILRDTSYVIKANSNLVNPFCKATLNGVVEFVPPD